MNGIGQLQLSDLFFDDSLIYRSSRSGMSNIT